MAHIDTILSNDIETYDTRELAWELEQHHPEQQRIKLLLEQGADLVAALRLAHMSQKDLDKKPSLKPLQLSKRLSASA